MGRSHEPEAGLGCFILAAVCVVIYFFMQNTGSGVIAAIVALVILIITRPASSCHICGLDFKRESYSWKLEGKNRLVCPNCNRKLEKRQSDAAFKEYESKHLE